MKRVIVIATIVSIVLMVAWKVSEPLRQRRTKQTEILQTSDAGKVDRVIRIWGDDWLGYLVFRSKIFQRELQKHRLGVKYEMVPDFKERFAGLEKGACDLVAATIDSYLLNARDLDYPGVIVFVIDESYGGDAIVGGQKIKSLDDLNRKGVKGAFVGYSPSEFLLKAEVAHFKLNDLLPQVGGFRVDNVEAAYKKLALGQIDFAVLWEPFVSRALKEITGAKSLINTAQAQGIVIDVAIASRKLVAKDPDVTERVARAYFSALHEYLNSAPAFHELAAADSGKDEVTAGQMLNGIKFVSFADNCHEWFSVAKKGGEERLTDSIRRIEKILAAVGDLKDDPLQGNPYTIVNSHLLQGIFDKQGDRWLPPSPNVSVSTATMKPSSAFFRSLAEQDWQKAARNIVGTLVDRPITFDTGQSEIPDEFQDLLRDATYKLAHYPTQRIVIEAHVSPGDNPQMDQELSEQRALAIKGFLVKECNVSEERIWARGLGAANPPNMYPDESAQAWKRRCRRAKIYLVQE
ncbi:MAG: OmpA family protein [Verrucomicrobia bacterium]|nr:OmpA family protein [Verrucomicrobiota bacterium]